jgi:hypothetical protein
MARNRGQSSGGETDTSRQKDRKEEPVKYEDDEPLYVNKGDGSNFISMVRTKVIGQTSGDLKAEFVKIQAGFYGGDNKDKPFYPRKENMKWPTVQPGNLPDLIFGLEDLMTDEEYEAYEKLREENEKE